MPGQKVLHHLEDFKLSNSTDIFALIRAPANRFDQCSACLVEPPAKFSFAAVTLQGLANPQIIKVSCHVTQI